LQVLSGPIRVYQGLFWRYLALAFSSVTALLSSDATNPEIEAGKVIRPSFALDDLYSAEPFPVRPKRAQIFRDQRVR
jgi:hypothetical protein